MDKLHGGKSESQTLSCGSGDGAAACQEDLERCEDEIQHELWIPFDDFTWHNLPDPFKNMLVKEMIDLKSKWTVRIMRRKTSSRRPSLYGSECDDTKKVYGSGTFFFNDDIKEIECPLPTCPEKNPHKVVGPLKILTAPYVIFNNSEAESCIIDFFFDKQNRDQVLTAQGCRIRHIIEVNSPLCIVECVSHDLSLLPQLKDNQMKLQSLLKKIKSQRHTANMTGDSLIVFIAHPHGLSKHVAVGKLVKKEKKFVSTKQMSPACTFTQCQLTYQTPGCFGSGGGSVLEIGIDGSCWSFGLHRGQNPDGSRVSGHAWTAN